MTWAGRGFHQFGNASGILRIDMMGDEMELPYRAQFYIESFGEIAAAAAQLPDGEKWLYLSRTEDGDVYTQTGKRDGDVDLGKTRLVTTVKTERDGILMSHIIACGAGIQADKEGLKKDITRAPQKAADLAVQVMKKMMAGGR